MAQVEEYLPSKCEALISNPNITKKFICIQKKKSYVREVFMLKEFVKSNVLN
jgi:hypothetical protein